VGEGIMVKGTSKQIHINYAQSLPWLIMK